MVVPWLVLVRRPLCRRHPLFDGLLVIPLVIELPLERVRQDLQRLGRGRTVRWDADD